MSKIKKILPVVLAALIVCVIVVIMILQPKKLDFWTHVDTHTKDIYYAPKDGWEIEYIDVLHKETPDSDFESVRLKDEEKIDELIDILSEIKVKDNPGDERDMTEYSYSVFISYSNYMDVIIDFDEDLDEMWIVYSLNHPPVYKITNTSGFREYLHELFQ